MNYYYLICNENTPVKHGPYTLVRHDELTDWESTDNLPELHSLFPTVDTGRLELLAPVPRYSMAFRTCLFIVFGILLFLFLPLILLFFGLA